MQTLHAKLIYLRQQTNNPLLAAEEAMTAWDQAAEEWQRENPGVDYDQLPPPAYQNRIRLIEARQIQLLLL